MIQARFERSADGKTLLFSVSGHAGQNVHGCDVVCAAASILATTLGQTVWYLHDQRKLKRTPAVRLNPGDAVITCKPSKGYDQEAVCAFEFARTGFGLLEEAYPEYVKITNVW